MNSAHYNSLLDKLDEFIRKYYTNRLIRGGLYSLGLIGGFYLLIVLLEAAGRFGTGVRMIIFFSFLLFFAAVLLRYIVTPALKLFQIGDRISKEMAAEIIGKHFSGIDDKLLNTLELKRLADLNKSQQELIEASIEQRSIELKPVPFSSAINLSENKRYLKFALPPIGAILILLFAAPSLITGPTERILGFSNHYEEPTPFRFILKNKDLQAVKNDDFLIELSIEGDEIPKEAYIEANGLKYQLDKVAEGKFKYLSQNVQQNVEFQFYASGYYSEGYELKVFPRPVVKRSEINLTYPRYLKKENERLNGLSDVFIPEGTTVEWNLVTEHVDALSIEYGDSLFDAKRDGQNRYSFEGVMNDNSTIKAFLAENNLGKVDSLLLQVHVIKDEFPKVSMRKLDDSLSVDKVYFAGQANDDYGFTALNFVYSINSGVEVREKLGFNPNHQIVEFYHIWRMANLNLNPEDEVVYYFEAYDNDGVNGPKHARSDAMYYKVPSEREIQEESDEKSEETKKSLEASIEEAKKMAQEIDKLSQKMIEKKNLDWEEKKQLEELLQQQKELQENFEKLKKQNELNNDKRNQHSPNSEELIKKQQQLEELMNKVLDEEMKKMLEDIQKMLEEANKQKMQEKLDDLKLDNKDLEKELDRSLELFKQYEFEKKLEDVMKNLDDLSKKQEKLADKNLDKKNSTDSLNQEQKQLEKEFEKVQEDMKDLEKKNDQLEEKNKLPDTKQDQEEAKQEMQKAQEQNKSNNRKKASQNQKNAAKKMEQMQQKLQSMQQQMEEQKQAEDLEKLRRLRQSLLELSFAQEELIENIKVTAGNDPRFVQLTRDQKRIQDDSKMIEDSLFALSKRNVQIQSMVNREISLINDNMGKVVKSMADRKVPEALKRQQYVMTSLNNLALMLDESIQQSQKEQSSKKFGKKSCTKPGGGSPSVGEMKKAQESLSKQLKSLQEQMKKGGKKPGGKGGSSVRGSKMSEKAAKMAAEQGAIRNELRKLMEGQEGQPGGKQGGDQLKEIHDLMEQNEEDLVNMQISRETIRRQEEIMSRLLESEKAEREREFDNKRESEVGIDQPQENSILDEYLREKEKQIELLETIPVELKPFYRNKVNGYYKKY